MGRVGGEQGERAWRGRETGRIGEGSYDGAQDGDLRGEQDERGLTGVGDERGGHEREMGGIPRRGAGEQGEGRGGLTQSAMYNTIDV